MKYIIFLIVLLIGFSSEAQPNICVNPPSGFQIGGGFDITILRGSTPTKEEYLCLTENVAVEKLGVMNTSNLAASSIRYIFGVDNATTIPTNLPLTINRDIDGQSKGEFWIMQYGEEAGQKKLNCKKIQIDVTDLPKVTLTSCNNQGITLSLETQNPVSFYTINWADGKPIEKLNYLPSPITISRIFTSTPTAQIEVQAVVENATLNKTCNSKVVKIIPPALFYIKSLEMLDFGSQYSANLQFPNPTNESVEIWTSQDGGIIYNKTMTTTTSLALLNNLPKKDLCFKIKYTKGTSCNYESSPVCAIIPKADNSQYGQIDLNWNAIGNQPKYEIKRTGGAPLTKSNLETTNYSDKEIACSGNYLYQITANYKDAIGRDTKVISYLVRSNANFNTNPAPKQALVASMQADGKPTLKILDATGSPKYIIYRKVGNQTFSKYLETDNAYLIDEGNAQIQQYCYYVSFIDACGNISQNSPTVCTMLLSGEAPQLSWTPPATSSNATVKYNVNRLNPTEILATTASNQHTVANPQNQNEQYQILAKIKYVIGGKTYEDESVSNITSFEFMVKIFVPNAFSPNGDGINDKFEVQGKKDNITAFGMQIFNQWGNIVFESDDINEGWDGSFGNVNAPTGIYAYNISYTDSFGFNHKKTGNLFLLR